MWFPRSAQQEIMDDASIQGARLDGALRELAFINAWLGGDATSRKGVRQCLRRIPNGATLSVLDVGAGGSGLLPAIASLHPNVTVTSLDLNWRACAHSVEAHPSVVVVNGSALALPFREQSFDIVHASLFLHHFTEQELRAMLFSLNLIARHGVVINDLRRSVVSYLGIALLTRLFSRSAMIKNDAPLSVRRGFTREELACLCLPLPSATFTIQRTWAFRWLVCIVKNDA